MLPGHPPHKADRADAKAVLEAARNEAIDAVPLETIDQQTIMALHRLRSGYLQTRTARINAVRGLLREFGITIPVGARRLVPRVRAAIAEGIVPTDLESVLNDALSEIEQLERKAQDIERRLKGLVQHMPEAQVLISVPGIPPAGNRSAQQRRFNTFRTDYNEVRPHEAHGQRPPATVYEPSTRSFPSKLQPPDYPAHFEARKVSTNGGIRWNAAWVNVSHLLGGDYIGLEEVADGVWTVHFGPSRSAGCTSAKASSSITTARRRVTRGGEPYLLRPLLRRVRS